MANDRERLVADVFIPCTRIRRFHSVNSPSLPLGCEIKTPSIYSIDAEKGGRLELMSGSEEAMVHLLWFTLSLLGKRGNEEAVLPDDRTSIWFYIDPKDKRRGPFPASQLIKWHSKGFFGRDFHCQHGATRAWMPLWVIAAHFKLIGTAEKNASNVSNADSLKKEDGTEADCSPNVSLKVPACDSDDDVDMEDVGVVVQELRHDKDFNEALCHAADMDVDEATMHPSLELPDPMDFQPSPTQLHHEQLLNQDAVGDESDERIDFSTALAMLDCETELGTDKNIAGSGSNRRRLYLVLDTNVLLSRATLRVLDHISRRYGPGCGGPIEAVAIVPWTVLLELDSLKARTQSKGDISLQARGAINALRTALDNNDRFYQGQTLKEYRAASKQYGVEGGITSADDRILHCCLYFADKLLGEKKGVCDADKEGSEVQEHGETALNGKRQRLVLISNDIMLRNKADYNNVRSYNADNMPISSAPRLLALYLLQLLGLSTKQLEELKRCQNAPMDLDQPLQAAPPPSKAPLPLKPSAEPFVPSVSASAFQPSALSTASSMPPVAVDPDDHDMGIDDGDSPGDYGYSGPSRGMGGSYNSSYVAHGGGRPRAQAGEPKRAERSGGAVVADQGGGPHALRSPKLQADGGSNIRQMLLPEVLASLTADLGPLVEAALRREFEELFESVVCKKIPWKSDDILAVLIRHWGSFEGTVRNPRGTKELLSAMERTARSVLKTRGRGGVTPGLLSEFSAQADDLRGAFGIPVAETQLVQHQQQSHALQENVPNPSVTSAAKAGGFLPPPSPSPPLEGGGRQKASQQMQSYQQQGPEQQQQQQLQTEVRQSLQSATEIAAAMMHQLRQNIGIRTAAASSRRDESYEMQSVQFQQLRQQQQQQQQHHAFYLQQLQQQQQQQQQSSYFLQQQQSAQLWALHQQQQAFAAIEASQSQGPMINNAQLSNAPYGIVEQLRQHPQRMQQAMHLGGQLQSFNPMSLTESFGIGLFPGLLSPMASSSASMPYSTMSSAAQEQLQMAQQELAQGGRDTAQLEASAPQSSGKQ